MKWLTVIILCVILNNGCLLRYPEESAGLAQINYDIAVANYNELKHLRVNPYSYNKPCQSADDVIVTKYRTKFVTCIYDKFDKNSFSPYYGKRVSVSIEWDDEQNYYKRLAITTMASNSPQH